MSRGWGIIIRIYCMKKKLFSIKIIIQAYNALRKNRKGFKYVLNTELRRLLRLLIQSMAYKSKQG